MSLAQNDVIEHKTRTRGTKRFPHAKKESFLFNKKPQFLDVGQITAAKPRKFFDDDFYNVPPECYKTSTVFIISIYHGNYIKNPSNKNYGKNVHLRTPPIYLKISFWPLGVLNYISSVSDRAELSLLQKYVSLVSYQYS